MTHRQFREIADRFNRELAGRFPFGELESQDASLWAVRSFFLDYEAKAEALKSGSVLADDGQTGYGSGFLAQMDSVSAFFKTSLTSEGVDRPLTLKPYVLVSQKDSSRVTEIKEWLLFSGGLTARSTDASKSLHWPFGTPIALDLTWDTLSNWRPVASSKQRNLLQVTGVMASFIYRGDWALLRMIESRCSMFQKRNNFPSRRFAEDPSGFNNTLTHMSEHDRLVGIQPPEFDRKDYTRMMLEFTVPVVSLDSGIKSETRIHLMLKLIGMDPKTKDPVSVIPPRIFPYKAPVNEW